MDRAVTSASVIINEVAWAGTAANPTHEWIELRNLSSNPVTLTGWRMQNSSLSINILLDGKTIEGNGYFLIERYEIATSVASDLEDSSLTFSDSGDSLSLYDGSSTLMSTANADGGIWPAGYGGTPVCSMERANVDGGSQETDGVWFNAIQSAFGPTDQNGYPICGTPKSLNASLTLTPTPIYTDTPIPSPTASPVSYAFHSVVINEVAWMGNKLLVDDEWIELYNPTNSDINLNGWILASTSSNFRVNLTGTIKANDFFVLGKNVNTFSKYPTGKSSLDQVVSTWILLNDAGDSLVLYDPSRKLIDTANQTAGNWPAGNQINACTMVRAGVDKPDVLGSWLTYAGTLSEVTNQRGEKICGSPWSNTWGYSVTPTRTSTPTITPVKTNTPTPTPTGYRPVSVILNEFLILPTEDHNHDGQVNSGDAFIEIVNVGNTRVSLNGWRLDDQPFDSPPYYIEDVFIESNGGKAIFFAQDTGILLSAGSDSVRLFKADNSLNDVKSYVVDPERGKSWCRFPDGLGNWTSGCVPSPNVDNNYIDHDTGNSAIGSGCDFRGLFDSNNTQVCEKFYSWSFEFTYPLFGEPVELRLGSYRLLIK